MIRLLKLHFTPVAQYLLLYHLQVESIAGKSTKAIASLMPYSYESGDMIERQSISRYYQQDNEEESGYNWNREYSSYYFGCLDKLSADMS